MISRSTLEAALTSGAVVDHMIVTTAIKTPFLRCFITFMRFRDCVFAVVAKHVCLPIKPYLELIGFAIEFNIDYRWHVHNSFHESGPNARKPANAFSILKAISLNSKLTRKQGAI